MVLDKGFAWNGRTYGSLSQIAKALTGTNWNGHRFFGLRPARDQRSGERAGRPDAVDKSARPDADRSNGARRYRSKSVEGDAAKRPVVKPAGAEDINAVSPVIGKTASRRQDAVGAAP
jgi:DUF2924 family protein